MEVHANAVMSTGLLPLARHYSSRLNLKVTIAGAVYCLIVDHVVNKKVVIGLTKDRGKGIKDKRSKRLVRPLAVLSDSHFCRISFLVMVKNKNAKVLESDN